MKSKLRTELLDTILRKNVRTLANYLYVLRGCRKGRDVEDWNEAEIQLEGYLADDEKEEKDKKPDLN